jgi:hypothetical protein
MRKTFLTAVLSAAAFVFSAQAFADPVERIVPHGKDGDYYYYQVKCTNGSEGSIVVQDKEKNVCAQAMGGQRICNATWTVQRAAEQACR